MSVFGFGERPEGRIDDDSKMAQAREALARCINFQDYCTNGIIEHLLRLKNHEFSFSSVQKILRQITRLRFRSALLEMLRSTYFKQDSEIEEKVKSMDRTVTLYAKSKKRDRTTEGGSTNLTVAGSLSALSEAYAVPIQGGPGVGRSWQTVLVALLPNLTLMLEEVLQCDVPKYFKVAALDLLIFILRHHDFLSRTTAITCFSTVVHNVLVIRERQVFDWKGINTKPTTFGAIVGSVKSLASENLKANKYLRDMNVELKGSEDPYLDCMPALMVDIMTFFTNFNNMLPSLAAGILHKAAQILIQNEAIFCFELPPKVLLLLCKLMEKTTIICQADLKLPISFISNLIVCQTVINNPSYRLKVEKSFTELDEVHLTAKETLALYTLYLSQSESTEELTAGFGTLWETVKTKYIFLVGVPELKALLTHMANRLRELALELEGQVLTDEFSEFDAVPQRLPEGIQELKFEKIEAKPDSPLLISSKDIIKTKIEYLKNFRDIFGEFEYYLELIDCVSANIGEKLSCHKENRVAAQDNGLDFVSKKLVAHFAASGLQLANSLDASLWELTKEVQHRVTQFLLVFLNDSVFVDYFQSTWVILCNLLVVSEETKEEKLNSALLLLLQTSEVKHFATKGVTNLHLVKCLHYVLEYTNKNVALKYEANVKDLLVKLFHRVVRQIRHTQNTDLVRLLRFLLSKFPEELNEETAITFFLAYLDKNFDIDSEGASKLLEQFFDIVCRRPDRDSILANLLGITLESSNSVLSAQKNHDQRQKILQRKLRPKGPSIKPKTLVQTFKEETGRKIKILGLIFDRLDSKVIVQLCKLKGPQKDPSTLEPEEQELQSEESQSSLYTFLSNCLQLREESLVLAVIRLLQNILSRVKPSSQVVNKGCLTVCSFSFRLLLSIASAEEIGAETQHELLSTSLIIFSSHLPPATFDQELELYLSLDLAQIQKNLLAAPARNPDICCFESLRELLRQNSSSKLNLNDVNYVNARLYEFMRLYMAIRRWVESPWSSIKSLFCNLVGFAIPCTIYVLEESILEPLKAEMSSLLEQLLESKESESVINGLNIMGALCGFGSDLSKSKVIITDVLHFFKRNSSIIPISVWEKVFTFQESWDITIQIASILMLQITLPNEYAKYIYRKRKQRVKMQAKEALKSGKPNSLLGSNQALPKPSSGAITMAIDKELSVLTQMLDGSSYQHPNGSTGGGLLPDHSKFFGKPEEEKGGITGGSTQNFTASNNHSMTGLSGDQVFEDDFNGTATDNTWIDKVFQEDELRQLLNLFKMHFNKEENKWSKLAVLDKAIEYTFDRDDRQLLNMHQHKLAADEIELQATLGSQGLQQAQETVPPNFSLQGQTSDLSSPPKLLEPLPVPASADTQYDPTLTSLSVPTVNLTPALAPAAPEKEHPVKKIIKMKNKLLEGLSSFDKDHGVKYRSSSEDVDQSTSKHQVEGGLSKQSKGLVAHQSQKGLPINVSAKVSLSDSRPRASTPSAPRSQFLGTESQSAGQATSSGHAGHIATSSLVQASTGVRKNATRKEISRVLSSQLMKHPTEGASAFSTKSMTSPKGMTGLDHAYIKTLLKPMSSTSGTVQRSASNKKFFADKLKDKQNFTGPVVDYPSTEEPRRATLQLGNSVHSDRVSTADFLNLKKRVIAKAEGHNSKPFTGESGLLSGFTGNPHGHIPGLGLQKPALHQEGVADSSNPLLGAHSSSKTKLLTKPTKGPSLLTAFKETASGANGTVRMTPAGTLTPETT